MTTDFNSEWMSHLVLVVQESLETQVKRESRLSRFPVVFRSRAEQFQNVWMLTLHRM